MKAFAAEHPMPAEILNKLVTIDNACGTPQIKSVIESLTPQEIVLIKSYYQSIVDDPHSSVSNSNAIMGLMEFGDDGIIARQTKAYLENSSEQRILFTTHPKAIAALAPLMFVNEPYKIEMLSDTGPGVPKSFQVMDVIRAITARSPYFSPEVNQWAAGLEHANGEEATATIFREIMCKWWTANQRYFYAGNYDAVQPGEKLPASMLPPTPTPTATPAPSPEITASPTPAPAATVTATAAATVPAAPAHYTKWPFIVAALALAVAVVALLFRRR